LLFYNLIASKQLAKVKRSKIIFGNEFPDEMTQCKNKIQYSAQHGNLDNNRLYYFSKRYIIYINIILNVEEYKNI